MASRRVAVLGAVLATLATASAAPAASLAVRVAIPPVEAPVTLPKIGPPKVEVAVKTPAVEASVEVSDRGVAASVAVLPTPAKASEPAAPKHRAGTGSRAGIPDPRRPRLRDHTTPRAVPPPFEPAAPAPAPVARKRLDPPSALSRPTAAFVDESQTLADALGASGTTAALAGLFLLAVVFASWIVPALGGTLRPPLLSFALQRPG